MIWTTEAVTSPLWSKEITNRAEKEKVARDVAALAQPNQVIGAGSGSTAYLAVLALGAREREVKLGLRIIATSYEIEMAAVQAGLTVTTLLSAKPDWGFDGTDEVDATNRLIKGRGGALLREKIVMASSPKTFILADAGKKVEKLGSKFAIPVEVAPAALTHVVARLQTMGASSVMLRPTSGGKDGPVITENGNLLVDVKFDTIADTLERDLAAIVGVVETGLFIGYPVEVITP